jgi:hypothetical protein
MHNEVVGTISSALSIEDRDHLCCDPPHRVELIVAIWRSNSPSRQSQRYIQGDVNGYRFRIAGLSNVFTIPPYPGFFE